jgi:phosphatidylinositol alpha-mannosyltransferase
MVLRSDRLGTPLPTSHPTTDAARERLRVCMMVTYDLASPGGGVKHHAQQLAAALRRRGDEVSIVGPSSAAVRDPHTKTFGGIVNVAANGSDNQLGILVSPLAVAKFFRENPFDVIHIHEPLLPSLSHWAVWATRHIPHVATFHAYAETEASILFWGRQFSGSTIFPWFKRAIAVSEPAARYAASAWKRPMTIIPNGVPTDLFTPPDIHANNEVVRLLFVGRIGDKRKGARILFEAYRGLLARKLPVVLDVVGELGEAEAPPQLPGLRYHGPVNFEKLVEMYRSCDVFVAPSTGQESFGIVLLEAMACAKTVVCSDIDGYRQVAVADGAHLVPPGDARALEDTLAQVVRLDPAARHAKGQINRRAAESYDWDVLAARVRAEYIEAMGSRKAELP